MAKKLEIGSTLTGPWLIFPGNEASLNIAGGQIPDTIFGQTFESNDVGLSTFTIEGNALYKGYVGYKVKIKRAGTQTAFTGEAMTQDATEPERYRITDATKNLWDRDTPITVTANAIDVTANIVSINYLFGEIVFDDAQTDPVLVTGASRALSNLCGADTYTLTMQTAENSDTDFCNAQLNGGWTESTPGLRTVSLELGGVWRLANSVWDEINSGAEFVIEVNPDGEGYSTARGFFRAVTENQSGAVGQREDSSVSFALNVPEGVELPFAWQHTSDTPLPAAIKLALDAWIDETRPFMRYVPPSVAGTPAMRKGQVVLTNMTMEGGLEDMNRFNVSAQGSGALELDT